MAPPETLINPQSPTETLDLGNGLSLVPRFRLLLTFFRTDPSVKPIDEWKIKTSLVDFLKNPKSSSAPSINVSEEDIEVHKLKDLKKRKREDPVASGLISIYDLSSLKRDGGEEERYEEWKKGLVERMDGIELNLEGTELRVSVEVPISDDFQRMKKCWEEFYAGISASGYSRLDRRRPDTLLISKVPSRWFAEPRVSSKASLLVTHTIFSVFGKIRKLNVASDDELLKKEINNGVVSGLLCKIWVQFERYEDFYNTAKLLCGCSLQKQGSKLKVNYEVTWDKDGSFQQIQQKVPDRLQERQHQGHVTSRGPNNSARWSSQTEMDHTRRRRFAE